MNRRVSRLVAGWRTGLSRPVLILQAGNALNYFGYGLVLPFEIIYLHQIRGFSTSTAGLVLAATMGTSAIVTPPTGALLDRYSAKAIVVAGSLASALGYAGFAFVERPWQAFACSIVGGAGLGAAGTANRTLIVRLVRPEQRAAAFALNRVAGNFGIGCRRDRRRLHRRIRTAAQLVPNSLFLRRCHLRRIRADRARCRTEPASRDRHSDRRQRNRLSRRRSRSASSSL